MNSPQSRILGLLAVATCLIGLLTAQTETFSATVVGISDGDTIRVLHDDVSERIRLWGIDCPEMKQPFGAKAKQFTGEIAFGKAVTVQVKDIDRYGRKVGVVLLPDGRNLNYEIVRAGFAWWFVRYARHDSDLERIEAEARAAKRGLWADEDTIAPWTWRIARQPR